MAPNASLLSFRIDTESDRRKDPTIPNPNSQSLSGCACNHTLDSNVYPTGRGNHNNKPETCEHKAADCPKPLRESTVTPIVPIETHSSRLSTIRFSILSRFPSLPAFPADRCFPFSSSLSFFLAPLAVAAIAFRKEKGVDTCSLNWPALGPDLPDYPKQGKPHMAASRPPHITKTGAHIWLQGGLATRNGEATYGCKPGPAPETRKPTYGCKPGRPCQ